MSRRRTSPFKIYTLLGLALVLAGTLTPFFLWKVHLALSYLVSINLVVLLFYGYDKASAKAERLRIPELVIHGFTFAGGTPAAFVGQKVFRHKTVKGKFRAVFWTLTVLQIVLIAWAVWYFELWRSAPPT